VVGQFKTPEGRFHGYLVGAARIATIDVPAAAGTSLVGVNNRGQLVGTYNTPTPPPARSAPARRRWGRMAGPSAAH
jgi:hypothetical protein